MNVFYCDHHAVPLPDGHRFPMGKYAALRRALLDEGVLRPDELHPAEPAPLEAILAVHDRRYVEAFLGGTLERAAMSRIGFPWSPGLVQRSLASTGATLAAARAALSGPSSGVAGALAGGTHHAFADCGAGYCVFNDIAVAARSLLDRGRAHRVLVFDVDVHQGDGTAAIFADEPRVFTCSIHGARNFPLRKQTSDLDVPLPDATGDEAYLEALEVAFGQALERARPDFVFYQGGVDPLAEDRLGRLALSQEGLQRRDERVFAELRRRGIPFVLTLGGGYAEPIKASVRAHVGTYRAVTAALRSRPAPQSSQGST